MKILKIYQKRKENIMFMKLNYIDIDNNLEKLIKHKVHIITQNMSKNIYKIKLHK